MQCRYSRTSSREKSVSPAERIFHANPCVSPKGWIAQRVLILLVEKIHRPGVQQNAVAKTIAAGDIEPRVTGIAYKSQSKKIAVSPDASKISA